MTLIGNEDALDWPWLGRSLESVRALAPKLAEARGR